MTNTFSYSTRVPHVPKWTLMDRLTKARNDFGMSMKQFSAFTDLSMRQIQYAEGGKGKVSDVIVTVYSAKTGVDYWWLKTGLDPNEDSSGAGFGEELPGLDSNQEPIGSQLSNVISLYRGVPKPPWFLEPSPPDTKKTLQKSQSAQSDNKTEFPKVGPETSNVYYLNLDSSKTAA